MATKGERFRYEAERSGPKRTKAVGRRRRDIPVDTAQPGVSEQSRRAEVLTTGERNRSPGQRARTPTYVFESSARPARPSRKSSRRSGDGIKQGAQLKAKKALELMAPKNVRENRGGAGGPARAVGRKRG